MQGLTLPPLIRLLAVRASKELGLKGPIQKYLGRPFLIQATRNSRVDKP